MAKFDQWPPQYSDGGMSNEEVQKRIQQGIKSLVIFLPIGIILFVGVMSSFYTVQPEERGIVLRFGKLLSIADPGLHFKVPFGVDRVELVDAPQRVLKEEFGFRTLQAGENTQYSNADFADESIMLTGDLNVIEVTWVVQFSIDDPEKYVFNIRDPKRALRDVSEAVMRRIVANRLGSDVLTRGRVEIALQARDEIQDILNSYESGIKIGTVELQDVVPPENVRTAFNEVNIARQERERMINEAEKRRNQRIPRVEGEAKQTIAEAKGYAAERINRAKGETVRFNALLAEYDKFPDVTRERLYLEMIDEVLPNVERIVVLPEGGTNSPLPLLDLSGKTPSFTGSK
ncbi:MAG: FtsH protease activity modulator HflK [Sumerlaeia bacterium]